MKRGFLTAGLRRMGFARFGISVFCLVLFCGFDSSKEVEMVRRDLLPVFGVHMSAPPPEHMDLLIRFIDEAMPRLGLNTLVLEVNYSYRFESHPELAAVNAIGAAEAGRIAAAARDSGVSVVPLFNCMGHQSWKEHTYALLREHPEFDEYGQVDTSDPDFYCRSWCPKAEGLHEVVFDLIDELARDFEAKAVHCGMDEVFIIADENCPRCAGVAPAELFAAEVRLLHDHLGKRGLSMWMWGDRLIDGPATGIHKWEASHNGTAGAIDNIPLDVVICDWHYEDSPPTPGLFAKKGFKVLSCPWSNRDVALEHLARQRALAASPEPGEASCALGVLQTVWSGREAFLRSALGESPGEGDPQKGLLAAQSLEALGAAIAAGPK